MHAERRVLRRINNKYGTELSATIVSGTHRIFTEVIDYNSLGVSLKVSDANIDIETFKIEKLQLFYGSEVVCEVFNPKIFHFHKASQKLVVSLTAQNADVGDYSRDKARVEFGFSFQGSVYGVDPFTLDQSLVFRMCNFSENGFALISSKSNRHLTVGLKLENYTLMVPGYELMKVSFQIKNVKSTGSHLRLGCKIIAKDKKFKKAIQKIIFTNSKVDLFSAENSAPVRQTIKAIGKFGSWIRVRKVTTAAEYEDVLKIRYEAYKAAAKTGADQTWQGMADEYDERSIVYLAYVGQTVVGTIRLVFKDGSADLPFEKYISLDNINGIDKTSVAEITRFAIHPHFQGTDVFFSLFRKIIFEIGSKGIKSPVCLATKKLSKYYKGIGAVTISESFPHPTLPNETLTLYLFDPEKILKGQMSGLGWFVVAKPALKLLRKFGFIRKPANDFLKYPRAAVEFLFVLATKFLKKKTKN